LRSQFHPRYNEPDGTALAVRSRYVLPSRSSEAS